MAQLIAIWYLAVFTAIHFTSETGAYFNDVETISGSLSAAEDFCAEMENSSDYHQTYCKDNSGGGNGPEPGDEDTGEGTDPDNGGHNKDDCDDHSNANCSENKKITEITQNVTSNSVMLSWKNPQGNQFSSVSIYRGDQLLAEYITSGNYEELELAADTTYSYKLVALTKNGKIISEETVEVKTLPDESSSTPETEEESTIPEEEKDEEQPPEEPPVVAEPDTTAPAEVTSINRERNGNKVTLTWVNPTDEDLAFVNVYKQGDETPFKQNITQSTVEFQQKLNETVTYIIKTVDAKGNISTGTEIIIEKDGNNQ
ncbi:hypothetical protein A6P54_12910 [Bacillus sp. MKU004]|nr:hypothetical protein A6P54_12910 [Bacillus sp. MKU004]